MNENPEEASLSSAIIREITPFSYGIEVHGDRMSVLIKKDSQIPTRCSDIYTTASDYQRSVRIQVLQGESEKASENFQLDRRILSGLPSLPAGQAKIEVEFYIDINGVLHVKALDKFNTSNVQTMDIELGSAKIETEVSFYLVF